MGTQIETLAGKSAKVFMTMMHRRAGAEGTDQSAFGVGAVDTRHALEIVAAGVKPLAKLLDALKAVPSVGVGGILIVVGRSTETSRSCL
jgi:hypothetical protein